jgi:metacaspase-1
MPKGLSLNIGINELQKGFYLTSGSLPTPQNDARAMAALALMEGYESPMLLLNSDATKKNFLQCLDDSIKRLEAGDSFLLSFSGHGGQVDDVNGDEADKKDETWCLYDEYLIDDEIGEKWKEFKEGVQIVVVSASCHSRTAIKVWDENCFTGNPAQQGCEKEIIINEKTILSSHIHDAEIKADILHISACDDKQTASAGSYFTKFTGLLLKHWDYGRFTGDYQSLIYKIHREAGYLQKPGIRTLGSNRSFLQNKTAFKINQ